MTKSFAEILGQDIDLLSKVGVYKIYHKKRPERVYVGSTSKYKSQRNLYHHGFYRRWYEHYWNLSSNTHSSKYLQNTINKYGIDEIAFEILEVCENKTISEIREREQFYIDQLKPVYNCFNTVYPQGRTWTDAQKKKQSKKMKGKALPNPAYEKIRVPVKQYNLDGTFIKQYESMAAASKDTKIDRASINKVMLGERISAGGFLWK